MSDDRWQRMTELFQQALDRPRVEVERFLRRECGEDHELERAVAALLEANGEAGDFLENPRLRGSVRRISDLALGELEKGD